MLKLQPNMKEEMIIFETKIIGLMLKHVRNSICNPRAMI